MRPGCETDNARIPLATLFTHSSEKPHPTKRIRNRPTNHTRQIRHSGQREAKERNKHTALMHEEQICHCRENQTLIRGKREPLHNPSGPQRRIRPTRRTNNRPQQPHERREEELRPLPVLPTQRTDERAPGAGDQQLVAGEDGDVGDAGLEVDADDDGAGAEQGAEAGGHDEGAEHEDGDDGEFAAGAPVQGIVGVVRGLGREDDVSIVLEVA